MNNTIIFELGPESQAKLDKILDALQGLAAAPAAPIADEHPVTEPLAAPWEPVAEPEQPKQYTKDDILRMVQGLAGPTSVKREQAKAIVKRYATKVSDIPADKYTEVMDQLKELQEA